MAGTYTAAVQDHFARPRGLGRLPDASGRGVVGEFDEGAVRIEIAIRVDGGIVAAARFRTFGCSAAIAASSVATTLIEGRPLDAARALEAQAITEALGGLPEDRLYAPAMAASAVRAAVADHERRAAAAVAGGTPHPAR